MDLHNYKSLFKEYKIKPCQVKLEKALTRIRMRCSAKSSENGEKLVCFLRQDETNLNQFTIQIKHKGEIRNISQQEETYWDSHGIDGRDTPFTGGIGKLSRSLGTFLKKLYKIYVLNSFWERFALLPTQR